MATGSMGEQLQRVSTVFRRNITAACVPTEAASTRTASPRLVKQPTKPLTKRPIWPSTWLFSKRGPTRRSNSRCNLVELRRHCCNVRLRKERLLQLGIHYHLLDNGFLRWHGSIHHPFFRRLC